MMKPYELEYAKFILDIHFATLSGIPEDDIDRIREQLDDADLWSKMNREERDRQAAFSEFLLKNWPEKGVTVPAAPAPIPPAPSPTPSAPAQPDA